MQPHVCINAKATDTMTNKDVFSIQKFNKTFKGVCRITQTECRETGIFLASIHPSLWCCTGVMDMEFLDEEKILWEWGYETIQLNSSRLKERTMDKMFAWDEIGCEWTPFPAGDFDTWRSWVGWAFTESESGCMKNTIFSTTDRHFGVIVRAPNVKEAHRRALRECTEYKSFHTE